MRIFLIKKRINETYLKRGPFMPKKLQRKETRLARKIERKGFQYEHNKKEFNKNTQKLHRRMLRAKPEMSSILSYDKLSVTQTRNAEKTLRKEFKAMVETIHLLNELVKNEDLDMLFDLKGPLELCAHFIHKPYKETMQALTTRYAGQNQQLRKSLGEEALNDLIRMFDELIDYFTRYIDIEYDLIRNAGFERPTEQNIDLAATLTERTRTKRSIAARANHIKRTLTQQEEHLEKTIQAAKGGDQEALQACLPYVKSIIGYFHKLEKAMLERMEFSHKLIIKSMEIAQEQRKSIVDIKQELDKIHQEFQAVNGSIHDQLVKAQANQETIKHKKKQLAEFTTYKKEIDETYQRIAKRMQDLDTKEKGLLRQETKTIKEEEQESKAIITSIKELENEARRLAA